MLTFFCNKTFKKLKTLKTRKHKSVKKFLFTSVTQMEMEAARYGRWEPRHGYLPDRGFNSASWRQPGPPRGSRSEHAAANGVSAVQERRSIRGRAVAEPAQQASVDEQAPTAAAPINRSSKGDGGVSGSSETEEALSVAGRYRRRARVPRRGRLTGRNDDDVDNALVSLVTRLHHFSKQVRK